MPKGGGALKGIDEKFEVNAANGSAGFSVPLPITPARNGFAPALSLAYNSGGGNSVFGLGWSVGLPSIQRKTDKRLPRYQGDDVFMFSGAEDLVPFLEESSPGNWQQKTHQDGAYHISRYRPRIEGGFARIEKIRAPQHGVYWKVTSGDNTTTLFGRSLEARIADPLDPLRIFEWLPEFSYDDKGNWISYEYKAENLEQVPQLPHERNRLNGLALFNNRYLKRVRYGNHRPYYADPATPYDPASPADPAHFFELVFDYGEHAPEQPTPAEINPWDYRPDAFSLNRSGFEIRTNRLCRRVLMFHHFPEEKQYDGTDFGLDYLVRSLDLVYVPSSINGSGQTEVTYLQSISQSGYVRREDGSYAKKSLPPLEFEYQQLEWNRDIKTVNADQIPDAPTGLAGNYQWVDLYGEGAAGILSEQAEGWYYKRNLGNRDGKVHFSPAQVVMPRPSFSGLAVGVLSLQDLEANGQKQVVVNSPGVQGYFELDANNGFEPFRSFAETANLDLQDPNTRLIDLNGDGQPELVVSEENVFVWYAAKGKKGHERAEFSLKTFDEERGPAILFADLEQTIFLADMSGDGLTDIVRIRNGQICYWANQGYGRFSAKITMSNAPVFDHPDAFHPQYLQLADVSGTGATDLVYLGKNKFKAYINLSGNAWTEAHEIDPFFPIDPYARVAVIDLLGTGTASIVWSSDLPAEGHAPLRYIDLMGSKKPHVMVQYRNNLGQETHMEYRSSTYYYWQDQLEGKPWITKLPFPVQVLSRTIVEEKISKVRFSSEYRYHHGYYDHPEREFRGFGMVEQLDTEFYESWEKNNAGNQLEKSEALYQAPMLSKTWFHTGAFLDRERILSQYEKEYWHQEFQRAFPEMSLEVAEPSLQDARVVAASSLKDAELINKLSDAEWREALRACKGMTLRQEVFALDAPAENASPEQLQKKSKPYSVATHNCQVQVLQPREGNPYAVFMVTESEAITLAYERDETDPRIAHALNVRIDERGRVLEAAAVVYPRVKQIPDLPQAVQAEQQKTLITYAWNQFTQDIEQPAVYRLGGGFEAQSFEITGLPKAGALYQISDFQDILGAGSAPLPYHQQPTVGLSQRRLIEQVRSLYYNETLDGPLPLGVLPSHSIPYESYQLAYTPDLLQQLYGDKLPDPDTAMNEGRYLHSAGDNNWWIRSGLTHFFQEGEEADLARVKNRFYAPLSYTDPFGTTTTVSYYKDYFLFLQATEDALGNRAQVERFNFRTLSPSVMRDINDNLSAVVSDELGLVKAAALLGKDLDGDGIPELEICDHLEGLSEISSAAEQTDIELYFQTEASDELEEIARRLLQGASSRVLYNFERYRQSHAVAAAEPNDCAKTRLQPTVAASITREQHQAQNPNSPLLLSFEYSDGLGNVAMAKVQAEPGLAKKLDLQADCSYTTTELDTGTRLRWIGNGRTVLNNKGNPVKQYEPYFSVTPHYEAAKELVETGVTPILYYDAPGRLIRSEMPNGTFSKVEFDAWQQRNYDPNDTVMDSRWYQERVNNQIDAELIAAGKDPAKEKVAAEKAAQHHNTPGVLHLDTFGRPIGSIDHNRNLEGGDEFYHTRIELDIEGNARSVIDARGNTVMEYAYDMLGHRVYQKSMDAGERWMFNNAMGAPVRSWDQRNHVFSYTYDTLHRPLTMQVEGGDGEAPLANIYQRIVYGEGLPDAKTRNLRGQAVALYDTAGLVQGLRFDLKGNLLEGQRRFAKDYKQVVNWQEENLESSLEAETFSNLAEYDALNRATRTTAPDGSISMPGYNRAGLLERVKVFLPATNGGTPQETVFVENIHYDEKGQRQSISYGNQVKTRYTYDPQTYQLLRLNTYKNNGELLQDLYYTFDPVGNITELEDRAIPTVFFGNHKIEPRSRYTYDALYRLIQAEGKEHIAQTQHGPQDNWNDQAFLKQYQPGDDLAWRTYTQTYQYDAVGNFLQMQHIANGGSWTRSYESETNNNRLKSTTVGDQTYEYPHHPEHGYMTALPHLQVMHWNFKEELQAVARQRVENGGTPETTYNVYDGSGQRVRKVTENAAATGNTPSRKNERLYLGSVEFFRQHSGNDSGLERTTLHIMDDTRRIAMVDTRNEVDDDTERRTIRYQLGNHLGSAALELNEGAEVISYEEYHPYGTTAYQAQNTQIKVAAKRYRYTGMERDEESGLEYHSARYYVGWLGRWNQPDPKSTVDGMNLYKYVQNNPIKLTDFSGSKSFGGTILSYEGVVKYYKDKIKEYVKFYVLNYSNYLEAQENILNAISQQEKARKEISRLDSISSKRRLTNEENTQYKIAQGELDEANYQEMHHKVMLWNAKEGMDTFFKLYKDYSYQYDIFLSITDYFSKDSIDKSSFIVSGKRWDWYSDSGTSDDSSSEGILDRLGDAAGSVESVYNALSLYGGSSTQGSIKDAAVKIHSADQVRKGQVILTAKIKLESGKIKQVAIPNSPASGGPDWRDLQKETALAYGYEPLDTKMPGSGLHAEENMNMWLSENKGATVVEWAISRGIGGTSTICTTADCRRIIQGWPPQTK